MLLIKYALENMAIIHTRLKKSFDIDKRLKIKSLKKYFDTLSQFLKRIEPSYSHSHNFR